MSKGLSLLSFSFENQNVFFYGVLKSGVTQDQIFKILQSNPSNYDSVSQPLLDLFDSDYSFSNEFQFVSLEQSVDCGTCYHIDFDTKMCSVQVINGGLGGISEAERDDSNCSFESFYIPDYKVSGLYGSAAFSPSDFITGVLSPVSSFVLSNAICLAFLSACIAALGFRLLRRSVRAFGRGR